MLDLGTYQCLPPAFRDEPTGADVAVRGHVVDAEQVGGLVQAQLVVVAASARRPRASQTAIESRRARVRAALALPRREAGRGVEELGRADVLLVESGFAVREVEVPEPAEAGVETEVGELGASGVEVRAPAAQRLAVVAADVESTARRARPRRPAARRERADRGEAAAREDRGLDEVGVALEPIEALVGHDDRLHRQRALVGQEPAQRAKNVSYSRQSTASIISIATTLSKVPRRSR